MGAIRIIVDNRRKSQMTLALAYILISVLAGAIGQILLKKYAVYLIYEMNPTVKEFELFWISEKIQILNTPDFS